MKESSPSGLLTGRDIVTEVLAREKDPKTTKISEIRIYILSFNNLKK